MQLAELTVAVNRLPAPLPVFHGTASAAEWQQAAPAARAAGGRLVSTWGSQVDTTTGASRLTVSAAYAIPSGLCWLELPLGRASTYADLSSHFPYAGRMQRATFDLVGLVAEGATDRRPWLNHGAWPADFFPLRAENSTPGKEGTVNDYPFVSVQGAGVH